MTTRRFTPRVGVPGCAAAIGLSLLALRAPTAALQGDEPPLARVVARVRTTSSSLDLSIAGVDVVNASISIESALPFVQVASDGAHVTMTGNVPGVAAVGSIHLILGNARGDPILWTVEAASNATTIDLFNENTLARPAALGVLSVGSGRASIPVPPAQLRDGDPLRVGLVTPRLVLAHFYPWFDRTTWADPRLADQPLQAYSTDEIADVTRELAMMSGAGIDGAAVSWQGKDVDGGWNDRRMRVALDAAARAGTHALVLLETTVANPAHDQFGPPADPATVLAWLIDVMRDYAPHAAYLKVDGRAVVLAYAANRLKPQQWTEVRDGLRARGFDPLILGENTKSSWLDPLDGQFDYASNRFAASAFVPFSLAQSLRVRTYHLLPPVSRRRIWAATVSPGYDDTRMNDGRVARVTPREAGAYYDGQWMAAIDSHADWVLITSWNEWWENTHVEPGVAYGSHYLTRTRAWSRAFKRGQAPRAPGRKAPDG